MVAGAVVEEDKCQSSRQRTQAQGREIFSLFSSHFSSDICCKMGDFFDPDEFQFVVQSSLSNTALTVSRLKKSGFEVVAQNDSFLLARLTRRLLLKHIISLDLCLDAFNNYSPIEKLHIVKSVLTLDLLLNKNKLGVKDAWIANFEEHKKLFANEKDESKRLVGILAYYGPQIALYFAWLSHYTYSLTPVAVAGLLVFTYQWYTGLADSSLTVYFTLFVAFWALCCLQLWKRKSTELSQVWGTLDSDLGLLDEDLALAESLESAPGEKQKPKNGTSRRWISYGATICLALILMQILLYSVELYFSVSSQSWFTLLLYSLLPSLAPLVFEPLLHRATDFEALTSSRHAAESLAAKRFLLHLVTRHCAPLYVALVKRDLETLRSLLFSLLVTGAVVNNATELAGPHISKLINSYTSKKPAASSTAASSSTAAASNANPSSAEAVLLMEEKQLQTIVYDVHEDHLELALQFSTLLLFGGLCPYAALFILLNNVFEGAVDLRKLCACRRPALQLCASLGVWTSLLDLVASCALVMNVLCLALLSSYDLYALALVFLSPLPALQTALSTLLTSLPEEVRRGGAALLLVHLLFALRQLLVLGCEEMPRHVRDTQRLKTQKLLDRKRRERLSLFNAHLKLRGDRGGAAGSDQISSDNEHVAIGQSNNQQVNKEANKEVSSVKSRRARDLMRMSQLLRDKSGALHKDSTLTHSLQTLTLFALPPALQHLLGLSPWLYLPCASLLLSYWQAQRDYMDHQAALGIVSDPRLLQLVSGALPSWFVSEEVQRVDWLNGVLQGVWPYLALAVEHLMKEQLQPLFDAQKSKYLLQELTLKHFKLGSKAPQILGVRLIGGGAQGGVGSVGGAQGGAAGAGNGVRLELDVRWDADASLIALKVGTSSLLPIEVALQEVSLSLRGLRVELLDLHATLPCVSALSICTLEPPQLQFQLKVAKLDVTALGAAQFTVLALLKKVLHDVLSDLLLYPKKLLIPLVPETEADVDSKTKKKKRGQEEVRGILTITIKAARDIKAANMLSNSSDPYVEVRPSTPSDTSSSALPPLLHRTSVVVNTLKPQWTNETFEAIVRDHMQDSFVFELFDKDTVTGTRDTSLGTALLSVADTSSEEEREHLLPILSSMGKRYGTLIVQALYTPVKQEDNKESKDVDSDEDESDDETKGVALLNALDDNELLFFAHSLKHDAGSVKTIDMTSEVDEESESSSKSIKVTRSLTETIGLQKKLSSTRLFTSSTTPSSTTPPSSPVPRAPSARNQNLMRSNTTLSRKHGGVLSLSALRVQNLKVPASSSSLRNLFSAVLRPCLAVTLGDKTQYTAYHKANLSPVFEETFSLVVKDIRDTPPLHIACLDRRSQLKGGDRELAQVTLSLAPLIQALQESGRPFMDRDFALEGEDQSGARLSVRLTWAQHSA